MLKNNINFCHRYYEYFGLIAIFLVFASWLVSSVYSSEYTSKEDSLRQIMNEKWSHKRLSSIEQRQINQSKTLNSIQSPILKLPRWQTNPKAAQFAVMTKGLAMVQEFSDDIYHFKINTLRLGYLSEKIGVTLELNTQISSITATIDKLKINYDNARKKYTAKQIEFLGESIVLDDITSQELENIRPFYDEYISSYRKLKKESLRYNYELNQLIDSVYLVAENQVTHAKFWKDLTSTTAFFIYIFGSILAILGKWIEVRNKLNET